MRPFFLLIIFLFISTLNAFSLKDKIVKGKAGDYIIAEQNNTLSILFIRSITTTDLILEEIHTTSPKPDTSTWKEWVAQGAPGYMAWTSYLIDLTTGSLKECYSHSSHSPMVIWIPVHDPYHFLPRLLALPLEKTPDDRRKRIGPPPNPNDTDRRSLWSPTVIIEGQKIDRPSLTAWQTKWPQDTSLLSGCEIELYFSSLSFPVWIEVRSPHYKVSLRSIDSGHDMASPYPALFKK